MESMKKHEGLPPWLEEPVGEFRRRPESEPFFRLARLVPSASVGNSKQAMLVLSSMQPGGKRAARSQIEFSDRLLGVDPFLNGYCGHVCFERLAHFKRNGLLTQ